MMSRFQFVHGMIVGAALLAVGWLLSGAQRVVPANDPPSDRRPAQFIQAGRIEIVDQAGTVLLALAADEAGGTVSIRDRLGRTAFKAFVDDAGGAVQIRDPQRNVPAASLQTVGSGAELSLLDADGRCAVRAASHGDMPRITIAGKRGNDAVVLDRTSQDCGRLRTLRPDGTTIVELNHDAALGGLIETYAPDNHRMVAVTSTVSGHGRLDTFGPTGDSPLVSLTATGDNEGQIYTFNEAGQILAAIASRPVGPTLRLFNQFGEPVVTLQCTEDGSGEVGVLNRDGAGRFIAP